LVHVAPHPARDAASRYGARWGAGETVEIDETFYGFQDGANSKTPRIAGQFRNVVLTLVERGGRAQSFHVEGTAVAHLVPLVKANVAEGTMVMSDSAAWYKKLNKDRRFSGHQTVDHTKDEYVRGPVHTNTVEGYFSIFKRGMVGVYQHCSEKHLHRYLAEFDFRYSNRVRLGVDDTERTARAVKGIVGKRLTYTTPHN